MIYAAIDIHKTTLQVVILDDAKGELQEERLPASPETLASWARRRGRQLEAVAIEATSGWRWVARELQAAGLEVRLADPGQASALQGRRRRPKTDRLDARWLVRLLASEMLPAAWCAPAEIQRLRDRTRLRKAIVDERRRWAQRLHALLVQEGWPCRRGRLLTAQGQRWLSGLALAPEPRAYVETALALMRALETQLQPLDHELRRFAGSDRRCRALQTIYGVGPLLACHLLAEIGDVRRFRRPRQLTRASGLDPVVSESGDSRRRGKLSKQGSPHLRWALVEAAQHGWRAASPDGALYRRTARRCGAGRAKLAVARRIGHRAFHVLRALEAS
jgi:transposase